jgi:hypothetical protein
VSLVNQFNQLRRPSALQSIEQRNSGFSEREIKRQTEREREREYSCTPDYKMSVTVCVREYICTLDYINNLYSMYCTDH